MLNTLCVDGPDTSNFKRYSRFSKEKLNESSPEMVPSREYEDSKGKMRVSSNDERKKQKKKKSRKNSRVSRSKSPNASSISRLSNDATRKRSLKRSLSASSVK